MPGAARDRPRSAPEKTSLPAGTYKGVLDLSEVFEGFDGFDKFQHIGVYMGGTTMTFRELAFGHRRGSGRG